CYVSLWLLLLKPQVLSLPLLATVCIAGVVALCWFMFILQVLSLPLLATVCIAGGVALCWFMCYVSLWLLLLKPQVLSLPLLVIVCIADVFALCWLIFILQVKRKGGKVSNSAPYVPTPLTSRSSSCSLRICSFRLRAASSFSCASLYSDNNKSEDSPSLLPHQ
ncbi:hypothetical protein JZ751_014341, partial [Albula glossodonta]